MKEENSFEEHSMRTLIFDFVTMLFFVVAGLFIFITNVNAATTAAVDATVIVQNISVTVADGVVNYGVLAMSDTEDTSTAGVNDSQTATNNGNITENLNIRGQDSEDWTLAGTAGNEEYFHKFCITDCDGTPTWNALTTNYQTLASGVAVSGSQVFDLQIGTPTVTVAFTAQSVDVTVQAVSP